MVGSACFGLGLDESKFLYLVFNSLVLIIKTVSSCKQVFSYFVWFTTQVFIAKKYFIKFGFISRIYPFYHKSQRRGKNLHVEAQFHQGGEIINPYFFRLSKRYFRIELSQQDWKAKYLILFTVNNFFLSHDCQFCFFGFTFFEKQGGFYNIVVS